MPPTLPPNPRASLPPTLSLLSLPQQIKSKIYTHLFSPSAWTTYTFAPGSSPLPLSTLSSSHIALLHANKSSFRSSRAAYFRLATIRFRGFERFMADSLPRLPSLLESVVCLHLPVGFVNDMILKGGFVRFRALRKVKVEARERIDLEWEVGRPEEWEIVERVTRKGGEMGCLVELLQRVELLVGSEVGDRDRDGDGNGDEHDMMIDAGGREASRAVTVSVPVKVEFDFVVTVTPRRVKKKEEEKEKEKTEVDSTPAAAAAAAVVVTPDIPGSVVAYLHHTIDLRSKRLIHERTRLEWY